ncbi:helix-turn-helix domain-containing protein [Streptomyces sp.]|uniref:helix-turn-helix domain-containing protein n=1 Tax=Streptomyces sp. TaxID=1931 RepID=UPI0025E510EC|nr:helix-turn-helix domain-containing protein [Streptomyces sp.]
MRTWRSRFADGGLTALADRKRSGRPQRFTSVQVAEVARLDQHTLDRQEKSSVARKNPPSHQQHDQPPKDFGLRPLRLRCLKGPIRTGL